jgi:hypothetical protein
MLELAVAAAVPIAIVLPHLLPLHAVTPSTAAAVWLLALTLRALVGVGAAIFIFVYLPESSLFEAVTRWCLHNLLPLVGADLGVSGHRLAHAAVILPALALAGSLLWVATGVARAAMALNLHLRRNETGEGPFGSTIVRDDQVLVAVTGTGRARILVSDAALTTMDGGELAASVVHEVGHVRRRHRPLLVLASGLGALGRCLPGTAAAERELAFSLERDADEYAVRQTSDPLALASAICKAGTAASRRLLALGGRARVGLRLEYLLSGGRRRRRPGLENGVRALAVVMAAMALGVTATLPAWALATPGDRAGVPAACPH